MNNFSKNLIQETITYFKEKHNHIISEETACDYLDSLAGLYLSFSEVDADCSRD